MLRGRRCFVTEKLILLILCTICVFLTLPNNIFAQDNQNLAGTPTTLPSQDWQKAISQFSTAQLDTRTFTVGKPVKIRIESKGLNNGALPDQSIRVLVTFNSSIIHDNIIQTNGYGAGGYAFVPTQTGQYSVTFENISYHIPLKFGQISFSTNSLENIPFLEPLLTLLHF